ncbi:MAG: DUF1127 domain-containing protein [Proteobacteria bacterium]|nr:DUF1127 domain-containing protein [Pseudomonadota bacterium]
MNIQIRQPHLISLAPLTEELSQFFTKAAQTVSKWKNNYRSRKELALMDSHMLKDIGLTEADVYNEVEKPFWR